MNVKVHEHIFYAGYQRYFRVMFGREIINSSIVNDKTTEA